MPEFFDIAFSEAEKGMLALDGGPFGAVVVQDGRVIGRGHNKVLSSHDSTAHAEINAIREAEQALGTYDLTGCEIYTTCYPCPMCLGAIMWARISLVHYACTAAEAAAIGFDDQAFYQAFLHPDANRFVTLRHYTLPRSRLLLRTWLKMPDRTLY